MPLVTYQIQAPDGKTYQVTGPEGASDEQVRAEVLRQNPDAATPRARKEGRDEYGSIQGALTALNGLTFGFGDEIVGGAKGLYNKATGGSFDEGYESGRDYVRGAVEQFRKDHSILAPVADISGSLLTAPVAALNAVGRLGTLGRVGVAMGTGAATGAIQGAGEAETMSDVPERALEGGALGAAFGGGATGAGTILKGARDQIAPRFSGAAANELATRRVANAAVRDDVSTGQMTRRMEKLGPEATIADSAGENTRNLLDTVATLPGKSQDQVERLIRQRQIGRADRMDAIPESLGGGRSGDDVLEALQKAKETAAGPLYARVDATTVPITPRLAELSQRPVMKAALEQARMNVANEGREMVELTTRDAFNGGTMPLRFFDDAKKGLDDVISRIKRGQGDSNAAASTLASATKVKQELVRELDRVTTDPKTNESLYKQARDAFAGPAALQDAIEDGRRALAMDPGEINRLTFGMSASEKEAFRLGAADAYRSKIGTRGGQGSLLNAPFDRNTRMQMREIFGDERGYREAMSTLLAESELKRLERLGRGSQTAGREARMEDLNAGVLDDATAAAKSAASGNIFGLVSAARSLGGRLGTPETVRDEIGRILTMKGASAQDQLRAIDAIVRSMQMGNSQAAAIQGVLGGSFINP